MSGGYFDYNESGFCHNIFGYDVSIPRYHDEQWAKEYETERKTAVRLNPLKDRELSEMLFDLLYIVHQCDFYLSGDTGEDTYKEERDWFKAKWMKGDRAQRLKGYVDALIGDVRQECYDMIDEKEASDG